MNIPDLSTLPNRVDRKRGAELVSQYFFPVSFRTLEVWPLKVCHVNNKATLETAELFEVAQAKLEEAAPIMGGRRGNTARQSAA